MSEHRTGGSGFSSLLPTPSAEESTPTREYVDEIREAGIQPDERLYLPGRKWHSQRTLSRIAPALLPTPSANDSTGAEGETRKARQEAGNTGGPALRDITHLLPTPMANDQNPGAGGELRAAITHGPDRRNETGVDSWGRPNTGRPSEKLLPTPNASDGPKGGPNRRDGKGEPYLSGIQRLLPTPTSRDEKGRNQRDDETCLPGAVDRLLPTPQAADGDGGRVERSAMRNQGRRPSGQKGTLTLGTAVELRGELTDRPFADGNSSSDDPHPDQLTIADDSNQGSWSG